MYSVLNKKALGKVRALLFLSMSDYDRKCGFYKKSDLGEIRKVKLVKKYEVEKYIKHRQYKHASLHSRVLNHEIYTLRNDIRI